MPARYVLILIEVSIKEPDNADAIVHNVTSNILMAITVLSLVQVDQQMVNIMETLRTKAVLYHALLTAPIQIGESYLPMMYLRSV